MTSTLQIVDPDSLSTVLYDLNDASGTNSGLYGSVTTEIISDVDLGVPALNATGIEDAAKPMAFNRQASARFKVKVLIRGTNYDNLVLGLGRLSQFLADGCVMKWVPNGSSETRYIDVLPSPTPVLFSGRQYNMQEVTNLFLTPDGVELQMERLAYTRKAGLTAATNILLNPTPLRDSNADGVPDSWNNDGGTTMTVAAASEAVHIIAAAGDNGLRQESAAASASSGQVWTLAADVRATSGGAYIRLKWKTAANADISEVFSATTSGTGWQRLSISGTAPATTDHISARIHAKSAAATFDVRNVQLELAAAPTPFRVPVQTLNVDPTATAFAQLMPVYNPSDAYSPCTLELAFPDASSKIVEADFGLVSSKRVDGARNLTDFLNGPNYAQCEASTNGWTRTLGTATTSVVDANASAGNTAQYAPTTDALAGLPTKIVTLTRTTLLDSMRGRFKVYARVKGSGAVEYNLQLNWGAGAVAGESNDAVTHDCTDVTTFHYVYIDLGDIQLPREKNIAIGQLTLELYVWQSPDATGTATTKSNFNADHLVFVPTDDSAIASIPSASSQSLGGKALTTPPKQVTGDPVWIAGAPKSGSMRLNANNEAAGYGINTAGIISFTTGQRYVIRFKYHINTSGVSGTMTYRYGVADITSGTTRSDIVEVYNLPGATSFTRDFVLDDTNGTNAHTYQPRLGITTLTWSAAHIDVDSITIVQTPFIPQNARLRSDPGSLPTRSTVEQLDSSGNIGLTADATGVPFWLPPGLSLVYVNCFDFPNLGYDENQSTIGRTFTVTPTVYPRFWG